MAAITQLVLYFGFMITWIVEIYYPPAWLVWGPITVFGNLFISYNLLFDVLNVPISIEIILKEFTLEFFQLINGNVNPDTDDISLGLVDIIDTFITIGFFLNPVNIFGFFWKVLTGKMSLDFGGEIAELESTVHVGK